MRKAKLVVLAIAFVKSSNIFSFANKHHFIKLTDTNTYFSLVRANRKLISLHEKVKIYGFLFYWINTNLGYYYKETLN